MIVQTFSFNETDQTRFKNVHTSTKFEEKSLSLCLCIKA